MGTLQNDLDVMEFYKEITGVLSSLLDIPLTKNEFDGLLKEYCKKMDDRYVKADIWLNIKTDDEIMQLLRTDTIRNFLSIADRYLKYDKSRFSGMDIEKGYYNIEDGFYINLEKLYKSFQRRCKTINENINLWIRLHQQVTTDSEPQPEAQITVNEPQQIKLPKELDNDEAAKYFAKAIEVGVMDEKYNWLKGLQLLSCFARDMSLKLGLSKAQNSDGTKRITWKPFEQLFKIDNGKLRSNYNDIQKTGDLPKDIHLINKIFE